MREPDEHFNYLRRMASAGVIPADLADAAGALWLAVSAAAPGLPVPAAASRPGGPVECEWSDGALRLLARIDAGGPARWSSFDSKTGAAWGEEMPPGGPVPPALAEALRRVAASGESGR